MSTPLLLIDELCAVARAVTAGLMLETESGQLVAAKIIPGFLDEDDPKPGKPPDDSIPVPFVIVRFISAEDAQEQSTATVKLIATTYSKHGQGWRDPLELLERIRQAFLHKRTVANRFRLEYPIKTEMPEDRPWPYSVAWMTTTWIIAKPIEEVDYGDEYFKD